MENRFRLLYFRFDVIQENRLLVCGYWSEGETRERDLVLALDYTPLPVKRERQRSIQSPRAYVSQGRYTERFFYWVCLPEDYRSYERFRVFEQKGLELLEVLQMETGRLEELRSQIPWNLDEVSRGAKGTILRGWCIARREYKIRVRRPEGDWLEMDRIRQRRPDVESAYPECDRDWIHGFILETKSSVRGRLEIELTCDGKTQRISRYVSDRWLWKRIRQAKELWKKIRVYRQQFGVVNTLRRAGEKLRHEERTDYETFRLKYMPGKRQLEAQRQERFAFEPEFSVVVPLYRTPREYLEAMIRSVLEQTYGKWKLYLSDGSGEDSPLTDLLQEYARKDGRIRVIVNEEALRIAENTNRALEQADGEYIVFMDHDDLLAPDALYECVRALNQHRDGDMIYTDEDKVSMDGKHYYQPHFKPDFNLDLLRSANYICHLCVVRRSLAERVGPLDGNYEGSQDYDFILRCVEQTDHIIHIPKILYHWRIHPDSVAGNPESKSYAYEAGRRAILDHYSRVGIRADVEFMSPGYYRSVYELEEEPLVSIIIANKDHRKDLERCLQSIWKEADYDRYEILIVENNSREEETWKYYEQLEAAHPEVRILYWDGVFNYSAIQNFAVQKARGEYLLLLNNDTWMVPGSSLRQMVAYCTRPDVAVVGAKLLYPDDTIQHAGVIVGLGGVAGHAFLGLSAVDPGYFCRITCAQDYSAVTAACMLVKGSVYREVGGMDPELQVAFNDTDFCLRIGEKGYRIVYLPAAVWYHDESKTRGVEDTEEKLERFRQEVEYFQRRWKLFLEGGDPYYNPNLTLEKHDFSLRN